MLTMAGISNKEIGWRLRAARNRISETRESEFTQEDMGERLGVSYQNIGKAERGLMAFQRWNYDQVLRWAAAYQIDPLTLADWIGLTLPPVTLAREQAVSNGNTTFIKLPFLGTVSAGQGRSDVEPRGYVEWAVQHSDSSQRKGWTLVLISRRWILERLEIWW